MKTTNEELAITLENILKDNKDKRICVCGVPCTGKTTLIKQFPDCLDLDELNYAILPENVRTGLFGQAAAKTTFIEAEAAVGEWTDEIQTGWQEYIDKTVKEFQVQPGQPIFCIEPFVNCDLIIYLDIDSELLIERAKKRNQIPEFIVGMKQGLKEQIVKTGRPVINLQFGADNSCPL
ncbi:MAG: hypothetical protein FWC51_00750 [Proteobacteria bacterium]|nr:hypothetical protein [Pseudomonadota bacterium]